MQLIEDAHRVQKEAYEKEKKLKSVKLNWMRPIKNS